MSAKPEGSMRLAKFMAQAGVASRRDADKLIAAGKVRVNGEVMDTQPALVDPERDVVEYQGRVLRLATAIHLALHKPPGYTCSARDRHARKLALDLIPEAHSQHLFTVGRLDRDSEGLILVTNDGELSNRLLHPRDGVQKVYHVTVASEPRPADLARMVAGIEDAGDRLQAKSARRLRPERGSVVIEIVLAEGLKREVRRMCAACGLEVQRLVRTAFGPIRLGELAPASAAR